MCKSHINTRGNPRTAQIEIGYTFIGGNKYRTTKIEIQERSWNCLLQEMEGGYDAMQPWDPYGRTRYTEERIGNAHMQPGSQGR